MDYWENSLLADDSIKMKESFSNYLQEISAKEYFQKIDKFIDK